MATHHVPTVAFAFGLLGTVVSFMTFLAPLPTVYGIYKTKKTQGFQSIPYVVSLLSAMLLLYYGLVKKDTLLITINGIGCVIETAYVAAYLIYASKNDRVLTLKLFLSMNVLGYGAVLSTTFFLSKGAKRAWIIGWICMTLSLGIFVAPLCILKKVIKTGSVEFMPITLSIFLTLGAIVWFFYGFLLKDFFIAVPNVLGFVLGVVQMVLYAIYKKNANTMEVERNSQQQEPREEIIDVVKPSAAACPKIKPALPTQLKDILKDGVGEDEQIVEMPSETIKA
ncbi:bidirectional sugar transporter SWEET14-like [Eucalyptus grandis]|uniref:bidirectional sugar transporter SWEET14-like n=1 Tax=Eucalyptus grandis TaxID=71139 RepID=UPI00192EE4F2|nr:bidirectional sugar transporter SWEET14-like [Eucalyptus grandis]